MIVWGVPYCQYACCIVRTISNTALHHKTNLSFVYKEQRTTVQIALQDDSPQLARCGPCGANSQSTHLITTLQHVAPSHQATEKIMNSLQSDAKSNNHQFALGAAGYTAAVVFLYLTSRCMFGYCHLAQLSVRKFSQD